MSSPAPDSPSASLDLSLLVPVYNEVGSLPQLYEEMVSTCEAAARSFEIVFVDDGSDDGSAAVLDRFADEDPRVSVIRFRKNFGKSPALAAGFERVRGDVVITLDADLQDDPRMIPAFLERIAGGADLVSGWKQRRHDPLGKTLPSKVFNGIVRKLSGVQLRDFNCGFKGYRIECVRALRMYGGFHRFVPVFAADRGFKVEELVVEHRPRTHGVSKFGAGRFIDGLLSLPTVLLLTRYRHRPLHFFGLPGAILTFLGLGICTYLTVLWFLGEALSNRPLLILGVLLALTGIQVLSLGLMGEMFVNSTVRSREVYSILEVRSSAGPGPVSDARSAVEASPAVDALAAEALADEPGAT